MYSAMTMVLLATMAVPGDGPEKVSGEMEQRLDLRGEWVGERQFDDGKVWHIELSNGEFKFKSKEIRLLLPVGCIKDEGNGRLRVDFLKSAQGTGNSSRARLGIYKQEDGFIIMCWGETGKERPSSFRPANAESVLILHRIKPRK
jgi:hypothetical protein